jgi:hypothetical protein
MPTLQTYLIEPIWEQFCALLPERGGDHRPPQHPYGVVFEKPSRVLAFGCAYRLFDG